MNSIITDKNYLHKEEVREYDKIIAECMSYIYQVIEQNGGKAVLSFKNCHNYDARFLFKVVRLCNTIQDIPIYLKMKFFDYKKFIKINTTDYKVHHIYRNRKYIELTENQIHNLIKSRFPKIYSEDIFEKIFKEFWELKDNLEENELEESEKNV